MIYLELFWSFFQVGLFSIGGGYAAMPLIQNQVVDIHPWLTMTGFADIITIAEMTPGPIAVNAATFVGIQVAGLPGALIATIGCIFPSCVIVMALAYVYYRFRGLSVMQGILAGLRPAVIAMIASAGISLLCMALYRQRTFPADLGSMDLIALAIFLMGFFVLRKWKPRPYQGHGGGCRGRCRAVQHRGINKTREDVYTNEGYFNCMEMEWLSIRADSLWRRHINQTYAITVTSGQGAKRYILQKINTNTFKDPAGLMENVCGVTDFLREKAKQRGADPARATLHVVPTKEEKPYYQAADGSCWRVYEFVENTVCLQQVQSAEDFYQSAVAFGNFQHQLAEYPAHTLHETIPHFHDTPKRFADFQRAVPRIAWAVPHRCSAKLSLSAPAKQSITLWWTCWRRVSCRCASPTTTPS